MSEVKIFTREEIFQTNDIETRFVPIPEWGDGGVFVRGMSAKERDDWEASLVKQRGANREVNMRNARARLVAMCTVDENGNRVFGDTDVAKLGKKSAKAIDRIFTVAQELSGVSQDDLEELTENFDETTSDDLFLD